jgi:ribosomal protein S27AE
VNPALAALLILALIAAGSYIHILLYPWKECPRCDGGRRISSLAAHRDCGRCGATGRVRRWGARKES